MLYFWYHTIIYTVVKVPFETDTEKTQKILYEIGKTWEEIKELSDKLMRKFCYDYWYKKRPRVYEPEKIEELKDVEDIETELYNPLGCFQSVYAETLKNFIGVSQSNPFAKTWIWDKEDLFKDSEVVFGGYLP